MKILSVITSCNMFFPLAESIWNWEGVSICRHRWLPTTIVSSLFLLSNSHYFLVLLWKWVSSCRSFQLLWGWWHGPRNFRVCNWCNLLICFKNYCRSWGKLWICFMCASSACTACCSFSTVISCLSDRVKLLIAFQRGSSWVLWGCLSLFLFLFPWRSV